MEDTHRRSKRKSPAPKTHTPAHEHDTSAPIQDMAARFHELYGPNVSPKENPQRSTRKSQRNSQRKASQAEPLIPASPLEKNTPRKTGHTPSETPPLLRQKIADGTPITSLSRKMAQLDVQETPKSKKSDTPANNTRSQKRNRSDSAQEERSAKKAKPALEENFRLEEDEKILRSILKLDEENEHAPISEELWQKHYAQRKQYIKEFNPDDDDDDSESKRNANAASALTHTEELLKKTIRPKANKDGSISAPEWRSALIQYAKDKKSLKSGQFSEVDSMPIEAVRMYMAALTGDVTYITQVQNSDPNKLRPAIVDLTNPNISPLMIAAEKGHIEVLEAMKNAGAYNTSLWKSIMRAASREKPTKNALFALKKYCFHYDFDNRHAGPAQNQKILKAFNFILNIDPDDEHIKRWRIVVLLDIAPTSYPGTSGLLAQVRRLSAETTPAKTTPVAVIPQKINFDAPASMQVTGESKEEDTCPSPTAFVLTKNEALLREKLGLDEFPNDAPISAAQWATAFLEKPYKIKELSLNKTFPNPGIRRVFAFVAALTGELDQLDLALTHDIDPNSGKALASAWQIATNTQLILTDQNQSLVAMTPLSIAAERGAVDVLTAMQEKGWPEDEKKPKKTHMTWQNWLIALRQKVGGNEKSPARALKDFFEHRYASYEILDGESTQHLIKVGEMILDENTVGHSVRPELTVLLLKTAKSLKDFKKIAEIQAHILGSEPKNSAAILYKAYANAKLSKKNVIQSCDEAFRKVYPPQFVMGEPTPVAIAWRHIARTEQRLGIQQNAITAYERVAQFDSSVLTEADAPKKAPAPLFAPPRARGSWFRGSSSTVINNLSQQQQIAPKKLSPEEEESRRLANSG